MARSFFSLAALAGVFGVILLLTLTACSGDNRTGNTLLAGDTARVPLPEGYIDMLFAGQSIEGISKIITTAQADSIDMRTRLLEADRLRRNNRRDAAIKVYREIAASDSNRSVTILWAWNALRELGVEPPVSALYGVILEVPQGGGMEYFAVYADRSARYINHKGKIVTWEAQDSKNSELLQSIITDAQRIVVMDTLLNGRDTLSSEKVRLNFLTSAGIYHTEKTGHELLNPQDRIAAMFKKSTGLLEEIVKNTTTP